MYANLNQFREIGASTMCLPRSTFSPSVSTETSVVPTATKSVAYFCRSLAYGIKSYTYFTWWTTGFCDPADYGIISPYGEKTDIYDDVTEINAQVLKVGRLLRRLDALEVYHNRGTEARRDVIEQKYCAHLPETGRFIVSLMQDRETGRDYIMLVNKDYKKETTAEFSCLPYYAFVQLYQCLLRGNGYFLRKGDPDLQPGGFILLAVGQHDNICG